MFHLLTGLGVALISCSTPSAASEPASVPQADPTVGQVLFENVRVFDGRTDGLSEPTKVLVEGNLIKAISASATAGSGATVIDGGGRTLMPGLHDMHTHISLHRPVATGHRDAVGPLQTGAIASARVEALLMAGFTTIRDIGGPAKYMQKVVDAGVVPGPRIYPTEAVITQTSGHGDFRELNDVHPNMHGGTNHWFEEYWSFVCDGRPEVLRGVRESLRRGATQIKIMAGGGVSSEFDPLHSVQYTPDEVRAAVEAAAQWKTYVAAHCFTDDSIRLAVENGVKCIEHGPLMTEETAKLLADTGTWLVPSLHCLLGVSKEDLQKVMTPASFKKAARCIDGVEDELRFATKHGVKMAFGTDLLTNWENAVAFGAEANLEFRHLARFMPPFEALKMATSNAAELNSLTGPNNPYKDGPLGVIEVGAYADVLIVDGNPLEDIEVMTDPGKNFNVIMKDGVIYKNELE